MRSKRQAWAAVLVWVSALSVLTRLTADGSTEPMASRPAAQRASLLPAAVIVSSIYRVMPSCDVMPMCFSFLCNTLVGLAEDGMVTGPALLSPLHALYQWVDWSVTQLTGDTCSDRAISAQLASDTKKTSAALSSVTDKLLSAETRRGSAIVAKSIAVVIQQILEKHIVPNESILSTEARFDNLAQLSAPACIRVIATALLTTLHQCISITPALVLSVDVLMKCCFSPVAEHYVHSIVMTLFYTRSSSDQRAELFDQTVSRLRDWVMTSNREVGLAERAVKEWLQKNTDIIQG